MDFDGFRQLYIYKIFLFILKKYVMLYDVAKILTLYDECTLCYYPSKSVEIHRNPSKIIKTH